MTVSPGTTLVAGTSFTLCLPAASLVSCSISATFCTTMQPGSAAGASPATSVSADARNHPFTIFMFATPVGAIDQLIRSVDRHLKHDGLIARGRREAAEAYANRGTRARNEFAGVRVRGVAQGDGVQA